MNDDQLRSVLMALDEIKNTVIVWSRDTDTLEKRLAELTETVRALIEVLRAKA